MGPTGGAANHDGGQESKARPIRSPLTSAKTLRGARQTGGAFIRREERMGANAARECRRDWACSVAAVAICDGGGGGSGSGFLPTSMADQASHSIDIHQTYIWRWQIRRATASRASTKVVAEARPTFRDWLDLSEYSPGLGAIRRRRAATRFHGGPEPLSGPAPVLTCAPLVKFIRNRA